MNNQKKSPFKAINKAHDEIAEYIKQIDQLIKDKKFTKDYYLVKVGDNIRYLNHNGTYFKQYKNLKIKGNKTKYGPKGYEQIPVVGRLIDFDNNTNDPDYEIDFPTYNAGHERIVNSTEIVRRYGFKGHMIFLPFNILFLGTLIYPFYILRVFAGRDTLKFFLKVYSDPMNCATSDQLIINEIAFFNKNFMMNSAIRTYIFKIDLLIENKSSKNDICLLKKDNNKKYYCNKDDFFKQYQNVKTWGSKTQYKPKQYEHIPIIGPISYFIKNLQSKKSKDDKQNDKKSKTHLKMYKRYYGKGGIIFLPLNILCLGTLVYPQYFIHLLSQKDYFRFFLKVYSNPKNLKKS